MKLEDRPTQTTSTINAQGRIVIPADVRRALGLHAGDRVDFVVGIDGVRLVTARMAAQNIWANNTGGDAGNSTADVRAYREADQTLEAPATVQERDDVDLTAGDLLADLGIA